jgi:hypothetical protein
VGCVTQPRHASLFCVFLTGTLPLARFLVTLLGLSLHLGLASFAHLPQMLLNASPKLLLGLNALAKLLLVSIALTFGHCRHGHQQSNYQYCSKLHGSLLWLTLEPAYHLYSYKNAAMPKIPTCLRFTANVTAFDRSI